MCFQLQHMLMFAILNNVLCSIIMSANNAVNPGPDFQEVINYKNVAAAEIPEIRDKPNITTNVPIPEIQNTANVTSSVIPRLNNTNLTITETLEAQNAINNLVPQVSGLIVTNITMPLIPDNQNAPTVTATQVSRLNMTTNLNATPTSKDQYATDVTSTPLEELNITNGAVTLISEPKNTTNNTEIQVKINNANVSAVSLEPKVGNITNTNVAQGPGVIITNATQIPTVSQAVVVNITNTTAVQELETHDVSDTVAESFKKSKLVPDVISVAPKHLVNVVFHGGRNVTLGNKLAPIQVKDMPVVSWNASSDNFYTLIVVDPDLPSRMKPIFRSILHWLVVNIPGDQVAAGETLAEYIGAGPPEKSGIHRLTYLVYQQPGILRFDEIRLSNATSYGRDRFSVANFSSKYMLGNPVAGNFYNSFYDHYVPILYKLLGLTGHGNTVAPAKIVIATLVLVLLWSA